MKKLVILAVIILIFSGAASWYLASGSLNEFIKSQIETIGTEATGQKVSVGAIDLKLTQGAGAIQGLTLANPSGYSAPYAFSLGEIALDIDTSSRKEPYVIESLTIAKPEIFFELTATGGSNFQEIYDAISQKLPPQDAPASTEQSSQGPDPLIKISRLVLSEASLSLDFTQIGKKTYQETLPTIDLGSIGGEQGIPASKLGAEIAKRMTATVIDTAKEQQVSKIKDDLKEKAKKELGKLFDKLNKG